MVKRDSRVREYMKTHGEEVAGVQRRYDRLKELSLDELVRMAEEMGVDVSKAANLLISGVISVEKQDA